MSSDSQVSPVSPSSGMSLDSLFSRSSSVSSMSWRDNRHSGAIAEGVWFVPATVGGLGLVHTKLLNTVPLGGSYLQLTRGIVRRYYFRHLQGVFNSCRSWPFTVPLGGIYCPFKGDLLSL